MNFQYVGKNEKKLKLSPFWYIPELVCKNEKKLKHEGG
ncbi:hypothetical protein YN1HA_18830 [Sulfurisphaera ohwakuensis]